jgi:hypothetical protein
MFNVIGYVFQLYYFLKRKKPRGLLAEPFKNSIQRQQVHLACPPDIHPDRMIDFHPLNQGLSALNVQPLSQKS